MPELSEVMQLATEGRAEELRDNLRRKALGSLYYFAKVVCGYDKIVQHFHMPLCNDIQESIAIRKRGYLWPRKHFKSTIIAKSYPHWRLCGGGLISLDPTLDTQPELMTLSTPDLIEWYRLNPDHDPRNLRIGIFGESGDVAEKDLKDIKDRTENGAMFRWLFPEMIPEDFGRTKWTESQILLPRSRSFDEPTINCRGVEAKGTGFHYDIIIYDDLVGEAASQSEKIMTDALNWIKAAPGLLNDDQKGEELIAGTRWKDGEGDIYGWLMKNMPYREATATEPALGFRFSTQSCYFEPTTEIRFKERFTTTTMEEIRRRAGDYLFNCNYRNMPTPPEGAILRGYKFYTVAEDGDGNLAVAVPEDESGPVHINNLARLSFLDPSAGGRHAKCENAIAVVGTDDRNRHFVLAVWSANCGYVAAIEKQHELNDKYVCWFNGYEQVGSQKEISEIVMMRGMYPKCVLCGKQHRALCPQGKTPPSGLNKNDRIKLWLEPSLKDGRIYIRKEMVELIRQLNAFPNGDLVDIVDVLSGAIKYSKPYQGVEEQIDSRHAPFIAAQQHQSRTNTRYNYGGYC